jgi:CRISPR system Cascade subunit CasE
MAGFSLVGEPNVDGYETLRLNRDGAAPIRFSRLDFQGVLRVDDPARFLTRLAAGFGRSRAFGCGLMLIRRVP